MERGMERGVCGKECLERRMWKGDVVGVLNVVLLFCISCDSGHITLYYTLLPFPHEYLWVCAIFVDIREPCT